MQITENPEEIIIRYVPVKAYMLCALLVTVTGALFLWTLFQLFGGGGLVSKLLSGSFMEFIVAGVFGLVFLLLVVSLVRTPVATVTLSRKTQSVEAHFGRIFGSRTNRYYFTQVKNFRSFQGAESANYHLGLVLQNNDEIRLKVAVGKDKNERTRIVRKLNKFIKPPKPPKPPKKAAEK